MLRWSRMPLVRPSSTGSRPSQPSSGGTISALTSKQRAQLRSLAHPLKPVLQVGADGVSAAFLRSLEEAFNTRELLKVKVLDTSSLDVKEAARTIAEALGKVEAVQTIGRTVVLYRPFPEDPEIELP
jgi:RNA-binding protein